MKLFKYFLATFVFAPLFLSGCTSALLVKSAWNDNQIVIDGKDNDWGDTMFYIPDAQLTAGIRNDSSNMYIILKSTDRRQAFQIMGLGMTVWFDPSGGTSEKFGIHFPLGHQGREGAQRNENDNSQDETQNQDRDLVNMMPNEFEILGANENGPVRLSIADAKGIELQMERGTNGLIYELKVPLHKSPDHPYAINADGKNVGVEFEGGKFEGGGGGGQHRGRGMRGNGGGTYPGGGEGMPGGDEGGGPEGGEGSRRNYNNDEGQRQQPKHIDFWLKVQLAG